jgi:hypothetical protein
MKQALPFQVPLHLAQRQVANWHRYPPQSSCRSWEVADDDEEERARS